MPRYGTIISADQDRVVIKTSRRGICDGCVEKSRCSFDSALGRDSPEEVSAINSAGARVGDYVEFDLPGRSELKASFLVWVVPLAGIVGGAALAAYFHERTGLSRDAAVFIGALAGLFAAFVPVIVYDRLFGRAPGLTARVVRRVDPDSCPDRRGSG